MKNLSLILNAVLFVLVGILFYMQLNQSPKTAAVENSEVVVESNSIDTTSANIPPFQNEDAVNGKTVFIDYDSLVQNYDFFKRIEKDLEIKLRNAENELIAKQKKLEGEYNTYMQGQAMMTDQHRATKEAQLQQQNNEILQMRDDRAKQFANQEQELNEKLLKKLYAYFSKTAKQNNFAYILTYKRGVPGVVYGNPNLDITKQVVKGLNEEYNKK